MKSDEMQRNPARNIKIYCLSLAVWQRVSRLQEQVFLFL